MKSIIVTDFERRIIHRLIGESDNMSKASLTHIRYILDRIERRAQREEMEGRIFLPSMTRDY
jgi:hypothetical protein